jgi:hypothetical protein
MRAYILWGVVLASAFALSCRGTAKAETIEEGKISEADIASGLELISNRRVFFGHQSIGLNIIDGLKELGISAGRAPLRFVETRSSSDISGPGFYHAAVGSNSDPSSKLRDFQAILSGGVGKSVDVAFLKFCYVDIGENTDITALFNEYRDTMARLSAAYPDLILLHFTAPLTVDESGLKALVKRMLGRKVNGRAANERREAFNHMIRAEYGGAAPFFDLALVEASAEAGSAPVYPVNGSGHLALRAEYTDDGGHLNETGRRRVASLLAIALEGSLR